MAHDWTVALDTAMLQKLQACTMCGCRIETGWVVACPIEALRGFAIAVMFCGRCKAREGVDRDLRAMLEERYRLAREALDGLFSHPGAPGGE